MNPPRRARLVGCYFAGPEHLHVWAGERIVRIGEPGIPMWMYRDQWGRGSAWQTGDAAADIAAIRVTSAADRAAAQAKLCTKSRPNSVVQGGVVAAHGIDSGGVSVAAPHTDT